jgi:hypothetical protein
MRWLLFLIGILLGLAILSMEGKNMRWFWMALGILLGLFGMLLSFVGIGKIANDPSDELAANLGLMLFSLSVCGLGFYLAISQWYTRRKEKRRLIQQRILQAAAAKGGKITVVEAVAATGLDLEETKTFLDQLCQMGAGEVQLTQGGMFVYQFEGFLTDQERREAKNVMDLL